MLNHPTHSVFGTFANQRSEREGLLVEDTEWSNKVREMDIWFHAALVSSSVESDVETDSQP